MKKTALIIMMLLLLTQVMALEVDYQVNNLPYNNQTYIITQGIINETWTIVCLANCTLSTPDRTNITFNNQNETVIFNISIPANYTNHSTSIAEFYNLLDQNNSVNDSLTLLFNITLPTIIPPNNITITSITPVNGTIFGLNDIIPSNIIVNYSGTINYNKSNILLYYGNTTVPWILFSHDNQSFTFTLQQFYDGTYTGNWTIIDENNQSMNYTYTMSIRRTKPPKPIQITPAKGSYTTETISLQATMESPNYFLSYIINDGLPTNNNTGWISMSANQQIFSSSIDLNNQPVGQIYLRITDSLGNQAIYNTGIISSTTTNLDVFRRIREVEANTDISLDMTFNSKAGTGKLLRCKMDDFTSPQGGNKTDTWPIQGNAYITLNNNDYNLRTTYDQVIDIGITGSKSMELNFNIPTSAKTNYEYSSTMYCFLTP